MNLETFWTKVAFIGAEPGDCWRWTGAHTSAGYGNVWFGGRNRPAHRVSYETEVGAVPEGLQLDHLCRVRDCVNPEHLEAVTAQVNTLRGVSPAAGHAVKTHCPQGHAYDAANTYGYHGERRCRTCHVIQERRRKAALREARA